AANVRIRDQLWQCARRRGVDFAESLAEFGFDEGESGGAIDAGLLARGNRISVRFDKGGALKRHAARDETRDDLRDVLIVSRRAPQRRAERIGVDAMKVESRAVYEANRDRRAGAFRFLHAGNATKRLRDGDGIRSAHRDDVDTIDDLRSSPERAGQ